MSGEAVVAGPGALSSVDPAEFAPATVGAVTPADRRASRLFVHISLFSVICLQRFGLQSDRSVIFIGLPVFLGLLGWLLLTRRAEFRVGVIIAFMAFAASVAISMAAAMLFPDGRVLNSTLSPIALLINWSIFMVGPGRRFDRSVVIEIFTFYIRLCAVAGIIQYFAQFVGISIFSFTISAPVLQPVLVESTYAFLPKLEWGSTIIRSNGFFLLEPAVFSKLIVLGVCVEYFLLSRVKFLPVYLVAYLVSYSGTGLLSLLMALPLYLIIFYRESGRILSFVLVAAVLLAVGSVAFPDQVGKLTGRSAEFNKQGSSGYKRYVGQFRSVDAIIDEGRTVIGYGPGATDRASFVPPDTGGTTQKLIIDYGLIGLISFFTFLLISVWRSDLGIVTLLPISIFVFGGGMLFFSPFLIIWALLAIWSAPQRREEAGAADGPAPV